MGSNPYLALTLCFGKALKSHIPSSAMARRPRARRHKKTTGRKTRFMKQLQPMKVASLRLVLGIKPNPLVYARSATQRYLPCLESSAILAYNNGLRTLVDIPPWAGNGNHLQLLRGSMSSVTTTHAPKGL